MSTSTLTLLTQGTTWDTLRPSNFKCTFTADDVIARVEFWSETEELFTLLNVASDVWYSIVISGKIHRIYFVPDAVSVEKQLRVTDIQWDTTIQIPKGSGRIVVEDGTFAQEISTAIVSHTSGITFNNGVGTWEVAPTLTPNSLFGVVVTYKGSIIGHIVSNTDHTITLDVAYTNTEPRDYVFYTPFGIMLLARACVSVLTQPPTPKAFDTAVDYYTAPPWPVEPHTACIYRLSNIPISPFTSASYTQLGVPFETK